MIILDYEIKTSFYSLHELACLFVDFEFLEIKHLGRSE